MIINLINRMYSVESYYVGVTTPVTICFGVIGSVDDRLTQAFVAVFTLNKVPIPTLSFV